MGRKGDSEWRARALAAEGLLYGLQELAVINYQDDRDESQMLTLARKLHFPDDLRAVIMESTYANANTAECLKRRCQSTYRVARAARQSKVNDELFIARYEMKRALIINQILTQMLGLRSQHHIAPQMAALGLMAVRMGVPKKMWGFLSGVGVLPSKTWTERFLQTLVSIPIVIKWEQTAELAMATYDNCSYYRRK